jgi:hypothetical protein
MSPTPTVACADIGSTVSGKFGWWSSASASGSSPSALATHVAEQLNAGHSVALGFECPLFVPLAAAESELTIARRGEGNRPWSAAAGLGSMGVGVAQVPWVLRAIRSGLQAPQPCFLDWSQFVSAGAGLFVWEAFVSGSSKGSSHVRDAKLAVRAFMSALPNPAAASLVTPSPEVISLIGAALLRTGWSANAALLATPAIVLGPRGGA